MFRAVEFTRINELIVSSQATITPFIYQQLQKVYTEPADS